MTIKRKAAVAVFTLGAGFVAATGVAGAQSSPAPEVLEVKGEVVTRPADVTLPRTGSDLGLAIVGAGLAGAGVVMVVATRRRQSATATSSSS